MTDWDKIHKWLIYTTTAIGIIGWGLLISLWITE